MAYHVQISRNAAFTDLVYNWSNWTTSYTFTDPDDGLYYWRVRAYNDYNIAGEWSLVRDFSVITIVSCPVLFSHDGNGYREENPLLTACEASNYQDDVEDYYLVEHASPDGAGTLRFELRELEDEITRLQGLELLVVDAEAGAQVSCSVDGRVSSYRATVSPLSAVDHEGNDVQLRRYFSDGKPVLLTLNYYRCRTLCSLQLNGLVTTMGQMGWTLGEQYDVVTLSIDPRETPERAAQTRDRYLEQLKEGREGLRITEDAWPFLVSDAGSVKAVAEAVGFGYRLNPDNGEWLHTATLVLLSPDDTVSRYLYGVSYSPQTLRLSLAEASDGVRVSTVDQAILYCFQYDAGSGSYTPVVANINASNKRKNIGKFAQIHDWWAAKSMSPEMEALHDGWVESAG